MDETAANGDDAERHCRRRYHTFFENLSEEVMVYRVVRDPAGKIVDWGLLQANAAARAALGDLHPGAIGKRATELFGRDVVAPLIARSREAERLVRRIVGAIDYAWNGRDYRASVFMLEPDTWVCASTDVTEHTSAENALRESEERFRTMADGSPVILWVTDAQGGNQFVNRTYREYFGVELKDVERDAWQPYFHPEDAPAYVGGFLAAVKSHGMFDGEARVRRKDGAWRWVATHGEPRFAPGGDFLGHVGITQDVTERKHVEQELREANRRKSDFLAALSHELRNPLAPLKHAIYLLDRMPPGSPGSTRAKDIIGRQVDHLAKLVDDLLDISRIDHGKVTLRRIHLDARDVVRRACEDARPLFEERGIALRQELGTEPLWIDADPTRIAQIAGNILGNALKFTPWAGSVEVILGERDGACELRIRDTGTGIASDLLERIFEPFAQADRTGPSSGTGLGLGLALVRSLATMHGGTVRALSDGIVGGAEFVVTLPLARPPEPAEAPRTATAVPSLSVLIVEDNVDAGETLAEVLRLEGHRTRIARDGRSGVAAFSEWRPDVLFCDIGLPDMTGYDVVRSVRAVAQGGPVYAVALTGYAQQEDVERARESGFDAHLAKPLSIERLEAVLAGAARRVS
jgi:PAS domain S-box-containing protein